MFKQGKTDENRPVGSAATILANGTRIEGTIHSKVDMRIDGTVNGDIISEGKVVVGAQGRVEGNIRCRHADIMGIVCGNVVVTENMVIRKGASLDGDIETPGLELEPQARFNGKCTMQQLEVPGTVKSNEKQRNKKVEAGQSLSEELVMA